MAYEPWQPGMIVTQARLASISATWQDWTPVWTTSTGANSPSFGNAVMTTRFATNATTVMFNINITFGSSTNFGGGGSGDNWRFSLPVTAANLTLMVGYGELSDSSVGISSRMGARPRLTTTTTMEIEMAAGRLDGGAISGAGLIDAVSPWTWANGDTLRAFGEYEAAS